MPNISKSAEAIYLKLIISNRKVEDNIDETLKQPRPAWFCASNNDKEDYKSNLEDKISILSPHEDILICRDVHCKDPDHLQKKISEYTTSVLDAISKSVKETIPHTNPNKVKHSKEKALPGWNEHVKPVKDAPRLFCVFVYKINATIPGEIAANNVHIKNSKLNWVR